MIRSYSKLPRTIKILRSISSLSHINETGKAQMVNISEKNITERTANASGEIKLDNTTFNLVKNNQMKKGDVLTVAKIAGIIAGKNTSSFIPLCHNINLDSISVDLNLNEEDTSIKVISKVNTTEKTGVEMEALTATSITCLTIYDMCKSSAKDAVINNIKLDYKSGGKSGLYNKI